MEYKATWIYDHLRPMGFAGSYEIVKRAVHQNPIATARELFFVRFNLWLVRGGIITRSA